MEWDRLRGGRGGGTPGMSGLVAAEETCVGDCSLLLLMSSNKNLFRQYMCRQQCIDYSVNRPVGVVCFETIARVTLEVSDC